ncbi:hypothetical protein B0H63DRAFT_522203 [Podospora didyma]|uniref:Uncharacterized protein n=1 Tax=Podospora didyma TaxID=330526 RepID=A0AAE0NNM5_9PEZI|nr:hypothetical protein B0H63DRAFT_522203 [Podospora didyma]
MKIDMPIPIFPMIQQRRVPRKPPDMAFPLCHRESRPAVEVNSSIVIGTLKENHPVSRSVETRAARQSTTTNIVVPTSPTHRSSGAQVSMKPNLNWDENSVTSMLVDSRRSSAKPQYVQSSTITVSPPRQRARATAMVPWDRNKVKRVSDYNIALVDNWACRRLLANIQQYPNLVVGGLAPDDILARPIFDDSELPEERKSELVEPRTCRVATESWGAFTTHSCAGF